MGLRICFGLLTIWISLFASAQVHLAFYAGPQLTSADYTINTIKQPAENKLGVMAGIGAKVEVENRFYFFPAIYYSLRGYKVTLKNPSYPPTELAKNNNTTIHSIQIAPLFQFDLSRKPSYFFIRFGPSINIAVYAKEKFDTAIGAPSIERKMKFAFTDYGAITASANVHLGYQDKNGLMIFLQYEYGIGSMNNADYGPIILHRIVGISVGWLLKSTPNIFNKPHKFR